MMPGVRPLILLAALVAALRADPVTELRYLSGHGPSDAVAWDFFCTAGRRAGVWTTLPVPSNWELQGFGAYNYGQEPGAKADEHGRYRRRFAVPDAWKGKRVRLVFEGVMTDATVTVNGRPAGPTHQGGFYRFHYDVTPLLRFGPGEPNLLEVDVAKISANADTERAERGGDYWVFGGIFRPVWLEAAPAEHLEQVAIDARADGTFRAELTLASTQGGRVEAQLTDAAGQAVGAAFGADVPPGGAGLVQVATQVDHPALWSAETPSLYSLRLRLVEDGKTLHAVTQRFGFRTLEVRSGAGLFLNGRRIWLKGVDRHSFRPETGRALNAADCDEDARTIKAMNLNAVRMSHYPPDPAFLEACDELGLYVLDELSGWHHAHDTAVGRLLVREMIERDVNHPSILFWDNGNEGGWNRALDGDFGLYDPQHRRVLHPWELHDGVDTKHYPSYQDLVHRLAGRNVVFPTEFLHALYDGGAGAGLEDYWRAMRASPVGGGGFIWMFADEGVVRTDQGGRIDVFSTYDPDGVLGPHHEKEGSYYAVRDIWSPVQMAPAGPVGGEPGGGTALTVRNEYSFTSLASCRFRWSILSFPPPTAPGGEAAVLASGVLAGPDVRPGETVRLRLPGASVSGAQALQVAAVGADGAEIIRGVWPFATTTAGGVEIDAGPAAPAAGSSGAAQEAPLRATSSTLTAGDWQADFDPANGLLRAVRHPGLSFPLTAGPRLVFARPRDGAKVEWHDLGANPAAFDPPVRRLAQAVWANTLQIKLGYEHPLAWGGFRLEISPDDRTWKTLFDSSRRSTDGDRYDFPPQRVAAVRLSHVRGRDERPLAVQELRLGYESDRFPPVAGGAAAQVSSGTGRQGAWLESRGGGGLERFRWTLTPDGRLRLDFTYTASGALEYHGITFDHAADELRSVRWLGQGPYRVWKNRLRGAWLGVHEIATHDLQPGESWNYPESDGYFAGLRWARMTVAGGGWTVTSASPDLYLRVGTPRISLLNTTPDFPPGDLSFLHAIPPIGTKFKGPEASGPASAWNRASGRYSGTLTFILGGP